MIAIFLIGTMGVTTYKHFCSIDGASVSFFSPKEHVCDDDMMAHSSSKDEHECCEKPAPSTDLMLQDDCCQDEVQSFKISDDYNFESNANYLSLHIVVFSLYKVFHGFLNEDKKEKLTFTEPPVNTFQHGLEKMRHLRIWRL